MTNYNVKTYKREQKNNAGIKTSRTMLETQETFLWQEFGRGATQKARSIETGQERNVDQKGPVDIEIVFCGTVSLTGLTIRGRCMACTCPSSTARESQEPARPRARSINPLPSTASFTIPRLLIHSRPSLRLALPFLFSFLFFLIYYYASFCGAHGRSYLVIRCFWAPLWDDWNYGRFTPPLA